MRMKNISAVLLMLSITVMHGYAHAGPPVISSITPAVGMENGVLKIAGSDFGGVAGDVSVIFDSPGRSSKTAIATTCLATEITSTIPALPESGIYNVSVEVNSAASNSVQFAFYKNSLVEESIKRKRAGMADEAILENLFHIYGQSFGTSVVTGDDAANLKAAGFSDDYIAKLSGQPQNVTMGVAGVWLGRTSEFSAAPMLRIQVVPRSYFYKQEDYWQRLYKEIAWPAGLLDIARWDLNIGITPAVSTDNGAESQQTSKSNYVLFGLSHEINVAAFLNVGIALATDSNAEKKSQVYFGVTVDSNLLRELGLISE